MKCLKVLKRLNVKQKMLGNISFLGMKNSASMESRNNWVEISQANLNLLDQVFKKSNFKFLYTYT